MKQELKVKNQGVRKSRAVRAWVILFVVLNSLFLPLAPVLAYESLRQSDWSAGYGQQVWSDSTKFNERYHISYDKPGELTISPSPDPWWDQAWPYRRKITFNNLENAEVTHFPILVKLEHKVNINYSKTQISTGDDLRFIDPDGTVLPHNIERWDQNGTSSIWVKVPKIEGHSDQDYIYMYYGNKQVKENGQSQVFDNNFTFAFHLDDVASNNGSLVTDASQAKNNMNITNPNNEAKVEVDGIAGKAMKFDGRSTFLSGSYKGVTGTAARSISAWVKTSAIGVSGIQDIVGYGANSAYTRFQFTVEKDLIGLRASTGNTFNNASGINNGGWHHVGISHPASSGTGQTRIYFDGKRAGVNSSNNTTTALNTTDNNPLRIGHSSFAATAFFPFDGMLDEVRMSDVDRPDAWMELEYKTGSGKLQTYGNEELLSGELLSSIFDSGHGNNWGYLSYTADEPDKTAARVKIRTGNNMYLAEAPDFEVCDSIINKSDISTNNCVTDGHRYIQYQVILETEEANKAPIFKSISITDYLPHPVVKGISTQPQVTHSTSSGQASHKEQENIKPKPTAQADPRPSASPALQDPSLIPNHYPLTPILDFLNALFH